MSCQETRPVYTSLDEYPIYPHGDLGAKYTTEATTFKLWSPAVDAARVKLYREDSGDLAPMRVLDMEEIDGAWTAIAEGDMDEIYYTFQVKQNGTWQEEATDPYARAAGTNGTRGQVIDLADTNPEGWAQDTAPPLAAATDAILYELHVRDISLDPRANIEHPGKFLGLTERGTATNQGDATGLDHLIELGVTHVHLLPSFDYLSVNEAQTEEAQYNWGYDPQNYNVPEGSYSTNPRNGKVRVREFKQMVKALHDAGIRVVMDVVYNHTGKSADSHFQHLIPDYFYRFNEDGSFSNASGCGNEIASDRPMVRKYIRESLEYWVKEYHVDGFRFDLMAIHDIATMNEISQSLHALDSTILLYGEGWTAGDSPLPVEQRALKAHTPQLDRVAAFSDDLRDGLKGSVFNHEEQGFVSGAHGRDMSIRFGIVGSTFHPHVNYDSVNYSNEPWAKEPAQCINYVSCHDNHTLRDRLAISNPGDPPSYRSQMQRLALAIVLTSQGIPFLHAGSEMERTKNGDENSYKSGDGVNAIRYAGKRANKLTYNYVRGLIELRKQHPAFRLGSTEKITGHLEFAQTNDDQLVVYRIQDAPGDAWSDILVAFNGSGQAKRIELPEGSWTTVANGREVNPEGIGGEREEWTYVDGRSALILVR
ncbi:type I pullulanase [Lewinella sp. W8]|uniref:type I pullulanase n=1 Tax=Lewinella sp. W8 TaxID=2528208 RepID=UPI0020A6AFCE|nr:type I pullulanase [Lewinella sp. W8]